MSVQTCDRAGQLTALLCALCLSVTVHSQVRPAPTTAERDTRLAKQLHADSVELIMAHRERQCMATVGSQAFCDCLNAQLPLEVDYQTYVKVLTDPEGTPEISHLTSQIRTKTVEARDYCVSLTFLRRPK